MEGKNRKIKTIFDLENFYKINQLLIFLKLMN